jgi:hypothetical protein
MRNPPLYPTELSPPAASLSWPPLFGPGTDPLTLTFSAKGRPAEGGGELQTSVAGRLLDLVVRLKAVAQESRA